MRSSFKGTTCQLLVLLVQCCLPCLSLVEQAEPTEIALRESLSVHRYAQTECITSYSMLVPTDHPKPGQEFSEVQRSRLTSAGQVNSLSELKVEMLKCRKLKYRSRQELIKVDI